MDMASIALLEYPDQIVQPAGGGSAGKESSGRVTIWGRRNVIRTIKTLSPIASQSVRFNCLAFKKTNSTIPSTAYSLPMGCIKTSASVLPITIQRERDVR